MLGLSFSKIFSLVGLWICASLCISYYISFLLIVFIYFSAYGNFKEGMVDICFYLVL